MPDELDKINEIFRIQDEHDKPSEQPAKKRTASEYSNHDRPNTKKDIEEHVDGGTCRITSLSSQNIFSHRVIIPKFITPVL